MPNIFGASGGTSSILGGGGGTLSLLSVGKQLGASSVGLSSNSRAGINEFLSNTSATGNAMFSTGLAGAGTIEGLQTEIKAIRSSKDPSQLAPSLRPEPEDDNVPKSSDKGTQVNEEI